MSKPRRVWTAEETETLKALVGQQLRPRMMLDRLPGRSYQAIVAKLGNLGIRWRGASCPTQAKSPRCKPALDPNRKFVRAARPCLRCGRKFQSVWIGNRICRRCVRLPEGADPSEREAVAVS